MNILFVGHRRQALESLESSGGTASLLLPTDRSANRNALAHPHRVVDFDAEPSVIIAAASALAESQPFDQIVALTEAGVYPAAVLRDHYGLPGLTPVQALQCHDKWVMKQALTRAGVRCTPMLLVGESTTADELIEALGLPIVFKARGNSGSRGTRITHTRAEVAEAMGPGLMAEAFIVGEELSIEAYVSDHALLWTNFTRYLVPGWANVIPAELPDPIEAMLLTLYARAIDVLGIDRGMTHLEVFLTEDGPIVGEIAARPPGGFLMELISRVYGFDPWAAHLEVELGRTPFLGSASPSSCAGVYFLHPGPGLLTAVEGLDEARQIPGIDNVHCTVRIGDTVATRIGVGQSIGRILASGDSPESVTTALEQAHRAIRFELTSPKTHQEYSDNSLQ
jgi:biotin carboxylase